LNDTTQIHKIVFLLTLLLLFLCLEEASGWPWSCKGDVVAVPDAREDLYPALREMEDQKWDRAMVGFWNFMQDKEGHEEGYSLAQLGMARAAYPLGFKQLATESYASFGRVAPREGVWRAPREIEQLCPLLPGTDGFPEGLAPRYTSSICI
jgi:hypothetical protein